MSTPLEQLNKTELLQILANPGHGYLRLRSSLSRERLIHLIRSEEQPHPNEYAKTIDTRRELQTWIEKNWNQIGSQLPCSGPNRGRCTVFQCSEGRHLNCYLDAKGNFL